MELGQSSHLLIETSRDPLRTNGIITKKNHFDPVSGDRPESSSKKPLRARPAMSDVVHTQPATPTVISIPGISALSEFDFEYFE